LEFETPSKQDNRSNFVISPDTLWKSISIKSGVKLNVAMMQFDLHFTTNPNVVKESSDSINKCSTPNKLPESKMCILLSLRIN